MPNPSRTSEVYLLSPDEILQRLRVRMDKGLSMSEVRRRRAEFGLNVIPSGRPRYLSAYIMSRLRDVLVVILLIAGALSLLLGKYGDALIIGIAILLDSTLGFAQVWRTEKTLSRLRRQVPDTVNVIRGGESHLIRSDRLVPGDIIQFRRGEKIPADARLVRAHGLHIQEAILTGESSDVIKQTARLLSRTPLSNRANMVYAGTTTVAGTGAAVVTATGARSEFGKIAQVLKAEKSPPSPLRRKLQQQGLRIGGLIIAAVFLLTLIGIWQGEPLAETVRTAITLIVSAIPEDLTMILTIALTVGVVRILKHKGVVRELASGETLGAATVICTDKTGTLTQGEMTATGFTFLQGTTLLAGSPAPREEWHKLAVAGLALTATAQKTGNGKQTTYFGSATERCALAFAESVGAEQAEFKAAWRRHDAIAFDTKWKYAATLVSHPTREVEYLFVAGAPEVLLERSSAALDEAGQPRPLSAQRRFEVERQIGMLAQQGQRLMAVATKPNLNQREITHRDIQGLTLLGVLTIQDPIRPEVFPAIHETHEAGLHVKVVTGDIAGTAQAVARSVGLPAGDDQVLTGHDLQSMSDEDLSKEVEATTVFSRVEPLDKQRIIRALRARGHIVAMTGDGVNDAVALKSADIGVAMGSGSDIAKDSADLVLLDNSFATIVHAIREGRVIRDNVRKVIAFLLATNAAEVAIFFVSLLFGLPLPLLPSQILWINLVTDGTSDIALSLEPAEDDVMKRRPEDPRASLISKTLYAHIVFSGLILTAVTMGLYAYLLKGLTLDLAYARTMAFTFLSVASLLSVWSFRSLHQSILARGLTQNGWVLLSGGLSFILQLVAIYVPAFQSFFQTVPLGGVDWVVILTLALVTTVAIDTRKTFLKSKVKNLPPAGGSKLQLKAV